MAKSGEVYKSADGWRFRIRAGNGEIIAQGEQYVNREDAVETMESLLLREDEDGADAGDHRA